MFILNFLLNNDPQLNAYSLPIVFVLVVVLFAPNLSAWIMKARTSKQPQLLQTITYEIDSERIVSTNQVSENKLDWSIFNKAVETKEYYFLIYTINKNMFQFIPKRAFASPEQETNFRNLVEQKLGKIQDIQKGFRGWKLTLLTFAFFMLFSGGCLLLVILLES